MKKNKVIIKVNEQTKEKHTAQTHTTPSLSRGEVQIVQNTTKLQECRKF